MAVLPFVTGILFGPILIKMLRRLKFGQEVREEGPKTHLKKQGTPTMGGLLFIVLLVAYALIFQLFSYEAVYILASVLMFSAIGFADDFLKIRRKNSDGLSSKMKIVFQLLVSGILTYMAMPFGTKTILPFFGMIEIGWLYYGLLVAMYVSLTNAVNLTDGLDGLATTVTSTVMILLVLLASLLSDISTMELSILMLSSMLAFLVFNWFPAKMIMGDTGSFALGGYVGAAAVVLKMPLLVPIFGLIYVIENLSVMIQVAYYKRTKRRIFKMSPIHHHYELSGYSEVKIVVMFSLFTAATCAVAYYAVWSVI